MRSSHSSSHRSSHRSSMSRRSSMSHRSSMSRRSSMSHRSSASHRSSMSHRSSLSHRNSIAHNGLARSRGIGLGHRHTSSLGRRIGTKSIRTNSIRNIRSSAIRHRGISNTHAFAVGKSTGININGSHMGAVGTSLHRRSVNRYRRTSNGLAKHFKRGIHNSNYTQHRYTSKKMDFKSMINKSFENFYTIQDESFDQFAKFSSAFGVMIFIAVLVMFLLMLYVGWTLRI